MTKLDKPGAKERIIQTSKRLFLKQGYGETGLNQIVSEAGTVKASLYQHFSSKEELGRYILREYANENLEILKGIALKNPNPIDFVKSWKRILKIEAKKNNLPGCAMANFRAQLSETAPEFVVEIKEMTLKTLHLLEKYLEEAKSKGYIPAKSDTKEDARILFSAYEGVIQMWRLTGDANSIDDLEKIAHRIFHK